MTWWQSFFGISESASVMAILLTIARRIVAFIGVLIILWGACEAIYFFFKKKNKIINKTHFIDLIRLKFGKAIILGLEFIVASDIIETTAAPDYYSLGILASLVGIRTLLTFFMNREMNKIPKKHV